MAARLHANDAAEKAAKPPARQGDEKRGSADSRLDAFANKVRPEPALKPKVDRRRKRLTTSDINVPKQQINMSAVRFGLRSLDILLVCAIIAVGIWNGYIGINNRGISAPIAAAVLGSVIFIAGLFVSNAYRFNAAETVGEHLKTVMIASFAALGVWLTVALIVRPETFLPDALAKAGLGAIVLLAVLHSFYHLQIRRLHTRGALAPTIVMLGATESARRIIEENAKTKELNILAIFDDRMARAPHNIHGVPVVGTVDDLHNWDALPYVSRIVVTLPSMANERKKAFVDRVRLLPNRIAFVVDEFETLNHVKQRVSEIAEISLRDVTGNPKSGRHTAVKRLLDIGISATALVLGAPILGAIALYIRRKYNLSIGQSTAEAAKIQIGAAVNQSEELRMDVQGQDNVSGLPRTVPLTTGEIVEALSEPLAQIAMVVKNVLAETPPELASDIIDRGIVLTGGGALLRGLDEYLTKQTGVPVYRADNPLITVATGAGRALDDSALLRRLMNQPNY